MQLSTSTQKLLQLFLSGHPHVHFKGMLIPRVLPLLCLSLAACYVCMVAAFCWTLKVRKLPWKQKHKHFVWVHPPSWGAVEPCLSIRLPASVLESTACTAELTVNIDLNGACEHAFVSSIGVYVIEATLFGMLNAALLVEGSKPAQQETQQLSQSKSPGASLLRSSCSQHTKLKQPCRHPKWSYDSDILSVAEAMGLLSSMEGVVHVATRSIIVFVDHALCLPRGEFWFLEFRGSPREASGVTRDASSVNITKTTRV